MRENTAHIGYYIGLLIVFGFGLFLVISASSHKQLQMVVIVLVALFYVIWGILHHMINHDLTAKIVVEYILIASFGIAAVFFLLKGALF